MINILIVEDNVVTRECLTECIAATTDLNLSYAANSAEDGLLFIRQAVSENLDILLLDIGLPGMSGLESIPVFKKERPDMDIIMFTTYDEEEKIFSALCAGATSYISKRTPLDTIMKSIKIVHEGGSYMSPSVARIIAEHFQPKVKKSSQLTDRQMEIVIGLVDGMSYQMIADKLNITLGTVRSHIRRVYKTLQVNSSLEVVKKYNAGNL